MRHLGTLASVTLLLGLSAGCASSPPTDATRPATTPPAAATAPAPAPAAAPTPSAAAPTPAASSIALRDEKGLGKVWLAPGVDLKSYDTLLVSEPRVDVPKLNPDGIQNLEWARGVVRTHLVAAIQERKLFTVVATLAEAPPGSRVLRLDNTIIEYEKGGGGARFFAGIYGAGHPVIKVRGQLMAADMPLLVYEVRRSSVAASAWIVGGYRTDKAIQEEDIKDLAKGVGDFMARTKGL